MSLAPIPKTTLMRIELSLLVVATLVGAPLVAQTRPATGVDTTGAVRAGRPTPGPVYEIPEFSRAVERGTRTRAGQPGPKYWTQQIRYRIDVRLDPAAARIRGTERVTYTNRSPDALRQIAIHLRQNVFAPGSPRRESAPPTDGMTVSRVSVNGGISPVWSPSTDELFFRGNDGKMMVAPVKFGAIFEAGTPKVLFDANRYDTNFAVSPDGKRLLMMPLNTTELASVQVNVIQNFLTELRQRVR